MTLMSDRTHRRWGDNLTNSLANGKKRIMRLKPRGCYKCLEKDTKLFGYGIDDKYNVVKTKLINHGDFVEDGLEVTFSSGRKHICTKDHPFKTVSGWETAKVGLRVAIAKKIPRNYNPIDEGEEYLMGLLVGDGCLRKATPNLSCYDKELLDKIRNYGFKISKSGNNLLKGNYRILDFYDKVRQCGLEGTNSWTKFIPEKYEGSSYFLRGLFDADGSVSKRDPRIVFVTVSERLANDVLRNLLYFGIVARKKHYQYEKTEKSPKVDCFQISIYGEQLIAYEENIGFIHNKKNERLKKWILSGKEKFGKNNNVDTIPSEWKRLLKYDEKRRLRYDAGIRIDNHYSHSPQKVLKCGKFLNNQDVIDLVSTDIFWDKIESIKVVKNVVFSAIESATENYISEDGIIHHNSSMYGVGFILWLWACQSPLIRIFYTSASGLLINEISDKINQYIGTEKANTFFSYIFGITKDVNAKNTTDVFNILGRSGKGFSLILKTAGSSTVGIHPNIIIIDDPLDISDRESEATRQQKERWFDSLNPLLVPFYNDKTGIIFETIMYIGTVWHLRDLIWYITEVINPKLPKTEQWDVERESIYTSEGRSAYPEIISDDKLAVIKATMSETFFASQYMNSALPEGLQVFDLKRLTLVRPDQIDLSKGEVLCVFDPSLGKSSSDYPAVWWVHFHEDKLTFFDAIDKKTELSLLVHHIASRNKEYQCRRIIFEDNGTILIKESLTRAHKGIDHNIFIDSVHHSTPKAERIMSIQSDLYSGFARFMSDYEVRYPEAMNQIVFYGAYGADDFPDCAQIAIEHFRRKKFKFVRYESLL